MPSTDQVTAVFVVPATEAVKGAEPPVARVVAVGLRATDTGAAAAAWTVTVAEALAVSDVAVTVWVPAAAGAV
jgi:hypothetical protein